VFCTSCGTLLNDAAQFCSGCGHQVGAQVPPLAAPPMYYTPPAVVAQGVYYGGFWRRFLAHVIDQFLIGVVAGVFGLAVGFNFFGSLLRGDVQDIIGALLALGTFQVAYLCGQWLYYAFMESSEYQATLGKMALGLKVTDLAGQRIAFGRATGRYFAKILSGLILMIGYIMAAFTERKQALHDMLASTLVVMRPERL
jgi:uncharacterized RDD family membrane protein YckC